MKQELLNNLEEFRTDLLNLRKELKSIPGERVNRAGPRQMADAIANKWVEELRSPLEHTFKLPQEVIQTTSAQMKHLHVLSRPNNWKSSYLETINDVLARFEDKFILPVKQTAFEVSTVLDLQKLIPGLADPAESEYLQEAVNCATSGFRRASLVMGWCAAIDRIQKALVKAGLPTFNATSVKLKAQTSGRFKRFNKEFSIMTLSDLQTSVFDEDLITVAEGMGLLDANQADRLIKVNLQYRNQSAHPGLAPIEDVHLVAFFTDINKIILQNPSFAI